MAAHTASGAPTTQASTDEAQVGNGGVREDAFGVALRDGHEGAEQKRDGTHARDHKAGHGIDGIERAELDHQEHAALTMVDECSRHSWAWGQPWHPIAKW